MIYKWYLSGQNEDTPHISSLDVLDDIVPWLHILWKGAEMQDKFGNDGKIDPLFPYYMDHIVPKSRLGKAIALPPEPNGDYLHFLPLHDHLTPYSCMRLSK